MQTVYTVALVLGLETVVAASFDLMSEPKVRSPGYLLFVLIPIVLLSIRFFWVPRNLNSYVNSFYPQRGEEVFKRVTMIHFPIALAHAFLFYFVCKVFVTMTEADVGFGSTEMTVNLSQFVLLYAGLLALNATWLLVITPRGAKRRRSGTRRAVWASIKQPGRLWAYNNLFTAALAIGVWGSFKLFGFSNTAFLFVVFATFILNSAVDLWNAAKYYIVYEDESQVRAAEARSSAGH